MCLKAKTGSCLQIFTRPPQFTLFISCQLMGANKGRYKCKFTILSLFASRGKNPAVPLVVTNVRIQTLLEILPQILCIFFQPEGTLPIHPASVSTPFLLRIFLNTQLLSFSQSRLSHSSQIVHGRFPICKSTCLPFVSTCHTQCIYNLLQACDWLLLTFLCWSSFSPGGSLSPTPV